MLWYRLIVFAARVAAQLGAGYWGTYIAERRRQLENAAWDERPARRVAIIWRRTMPGNEDQVQTGFHLLNWTDGNVDATWTDGDYAAARDAILTWWGSIKHLYPNYYVLDAIRFYKAPTQPGTEQPAAKKFEGLNVIGTGSSGSMLPPQVATTITLRTALRRNWGRMYLPAGIGGMQTEGRLGSTHRELFANSTATMFATLTAEPPSLVPVVYSPRQQAFFGIEAIAVDDVFDVIRSRRYRAPLARSVRPT